MLLSLLAKKQGKSWFRRYQLLFLEDLGIDWTKGPVSLSELEQLNLTRDDVIDNVDVLTMSVERTKKHAERFPVGADLSEAILSALTGLVNDNQYAVGVNIFTGILTRSLRRIIMNLGTALGANPR